MALVTRVPGSYPTYTYPTYSGTTTATTSTTTTTTAPIVFSTPPAPVPPEAISSVTGIDPAEVAAATYGKVIPMWTGGMPRLGCHIIFGPTITFIGGVAHASFGVSFGMPAWNRAVTPVTPLPGTRELRELRLDGYKVWSLTEGYLITGLTFRFYPGTETQAVDPLVAAAYPAAPVAHKGQACVFIENLPLTDFAGKVPFVSAVIADTTFGGDPEDGTNLSQALTHLAGSRLLNFNVSVGEDIDFEASGLEERVDSVIVAEKVSWLDLLNRFARLHLWDVLQTDKLLVQERGTVDPDITLDLTDIMASDNSPPIVIERAQQSDIPRALDYSYIDINRDYEINTVTVSRPRAPVPATVSAGKDTIALPSVHTVQEAVSWATLRRYKDELARETVSFTTSIVGYEIEPGDIVEVDAGFKTYTVRVLETLKGANWTNRIKGEPVLRCQLPITVIDPLTPLTDLVPIPTSAISASRRLFDSWEGGFYELTSGKVSQAHDQTGKTHHYYQTSTTSQPIIEAAGANSRAAFSFDGVDDFLNGSGQITHLINADVGYIICSFVVDAITTNEAQMFDNDAVWTDGGGVIGAHLKNVAGAYTAHGYNWDGNVDSTSHAISLGTTYVMEWKHDAGVLSSRINSGAWQTTASGNTTSLASGIILGAALTGVLNNFWTDIRIIEFITFDALLTTAQEDDLAANLYAWAET